MAMPASPTSTKSGASPAFSYGLLHPWTCRSSHRRSSWWCLLPSSCWSPRWCLLPAASGLTEEVFPRTAVELIELLAVQLIISTRQSPNSVLNSGGLRLIALEGVQPTTRHDLGSRGWAYHEHCARHFRRTRLSPHRLPARNGSTMGRRESQERTDHQCCAGRVQLVSTSAT